QPISPTQTNVTDEAASTGVDVRLGGATTIVTGLEAEQGSGNIDKTSTMPCDSPLPRVHTLRSDEDGMQHNELMDLVTKLSDRVVDLETAFTKLIKKRILSKKGRKIAEIDKDPDISLVQHDAEVQGRHKHDMEPDFEFTTTEEVYTAEKGVKTAKPVSTAGASVSTTGASLAKDNGKAIMEEAEAIQTKTKVEADEEFAQRLQLEERDMYSEAKKARLLAELINERKRYFANLFEITMRRVHTFVLMESESERVIPELAAGSSKRDAEEKLV
ncbi:hypothetical protein Tco_1232831, partial [Tanacetum coccineum]